MAQLSALLSIYHPEKVSFVEPFLSSAPMQRIDHVGMHCGMEYTNFPFYCHFGKYSRYEHSLGVAYIVYHFTKEEKMTLAGLFHDIATPCFAHVIDFLKGDHEKQEATEEKTSAIIASSEEIQRELKKLHLSTKDVDDYHLYPIADNDSPKLSADRLEYTLDNFINYHFASLSEVKEMYDDLVVIKNEDGIDELAFSHADIAKKFALLTLKNSHVYVADEDRFGMEYLARLLKKQVKRNIISEKDLYGEEETLIAKLMTDPVSKEDWLTFRSLSRIETYDKEVVGSYKINSKRRFINPLVVNQGRILSLDSEVKASIEAFKNESFDSYIKGFTK